MAPKRLQTDPRFVQHKITVYPGQPPVYDYAADMDGAPWVDMVCDQDVPPGHLLAIRNREHAAADDLILDDGTTQVRLKAHVRSIRVNYDPARQALVGHVDVIYLDNQGNGLHADNYVLTFTDDELAAHRDHETRMKSKVSMNLSDALQKHQDRQKALKAAH